MTFFKKLIQPNLLATRWISTNTKLSMGPLETQIKLKLEKAFNPSFIEIANDSHKHAHHSAMRGVESKETHFRVTIVSENFKGKNLMQRHRSIYQTLEEEMQEGKVHALQLKTKTAEEMNSEK